MTDISTANGMTQLLKKIINCEEMLEEDEEVWLAMKVSEPIVNNLIIEISGGKQYKIQVKAVSGWHVPGC
jgi:hypothetical protein